MASTSEALYRPLASVLRTLRSMRTALILLLVVGAASVAGSLVPQAPTAPAAVADLFATRPLLARVYRALGLFDVYGSWWFTLTYVLLLISLASCLVPRTRALVRGRGARPQPVRDLDGLRHFAEAGVPAAPEAVLARSRSVLRRRRFRVAATDPGLAAEKGGAREWGSLLFHWSLFLILVGAVYGKGFGLRGVATIVEGETWTEAHASYDLPPEEGRFFTERMHTGLQARLEDFDATYYPDGLPRDFVSRVEVTGADGGPSTPSEIRVNQPLSVEGLKLFQQGYGWAPVIEVRHQGRLVASGPVVFVTDTPNDQRRPWRGVIQLPSLEPQSVFTLDTTGLEPWLDGGLGLGETTELPGGIQITFRDLREYTQLLVKRDPGTGLMLVAAILLLAGLVPALASSRRRVWVRAVGADGAGTRLQVGGFALQRRAAFAEEFDELARELSRVER